MIPSPPLTIEELLERAARLDGCRIGELAAELGFALPAQPRSTKGHLGAVLERALGATAGSRDVPDFPELGVELKSVPLDRLGRVRESTFVCSLDLRQATTDEWERSRVRRKLGCVLWFPVESGPLPLRDRHLGTPRLWRPSAAEEALLRADWELLMGRIAAGHIDEISAHEGQALQIRPKARDGRVRVCGRGPEGESLDVVPRGFYLRARFTEAVLWSG